MSCIICCDDIKLFIISECGHNDLCIECCLKLRENNSNIKCTICKSEQTDVVISESGDDLFKNFNISKLELFKCGIYFKNNNIKSKCNKYIKYNCPNNCKNAQFENISELKLHLEKKHNKYFCYLCLNNRTLLISEQTLFTKYELNNHLNNGDYDLDGNLEFLHPYCDFCKEYYYNEEKFLTHMKQEHIKCHICDKITKYKFIYYANYNSLNKHFNISHFTCTVKECIDKCFIVFKSIKELELHFNKEHSTNKNKSKVMQIGGENISKTINEQIIIKDNEGIDISNRLLTERKMKRHEINKEDKEFSYNINYRDFISNLPININNCNLSVEVEIKLIDSINKQYENEYMSQYNFINCYKLPILDDHSYIDLNEFYEKIKMILYEEDVQYICSIINDYYKKKINPNNLITQFYSVFGNILFFKYFNLFVKTVKNPNVKLSLDLMLTNKYNNIRFEDKCILLANKNYKDLYHKIVDLLGDNFIYRIKNKIITLNNPIKVDKTRVFQLITSIKHLSLKEISKIKLLNNFLIEKDKTKELITKILFCNTKNIQKITNDINNYDLHVLFIYFNISTLRLEGKDIITNSKFNQNLTKIIMRHFPELSKEIKYNIDSDDDDHNLNDAENIEHYNIKNINKKFKDTSRYNKKNILEANNNQNKIDVDNNYDFPALNNNNNTQSITSTKHTQWGFAGIPIHYTNKNKEKIINEEFPTLGTAITKKEEKPIEPKPQIVKPIVPLNNKDSTNWLAYSTSNNKDSDIPVKVIKKKKRKK